MATDPVFLALVREAELSSPETEFRFHPVRRWRFDYAWEREKVALEIEGGVFMKGGSRHSRGAGFRKDLEKYNTATSMGWRVLRVLPEQLRNKETMDYLSQTLNL